MRLTVTLRAGSCADAIALEPAHLERFFRVAAYVAIREGRVAPAEEVRARAVAGPVRERHGDVLCLDGVGVELVDAAGAARAVVDFPRRALAAFALRRALHRLAEAGDTEARAVHWAVHAVPGDDEPMRVAVPQLAPCSLDAATAGATATGDPDGAWIATIATPAFAAGLDALAGASRAAGVERAARVAATVGFDPARRCFVRRLDRVIVAHDTRADALSVVSTAASWREFLAATPEGRPRAITTVHTHLHLGETTAGEGGLAVDREPCISIDDLVTHYTAYPEPLSASAIVSVFPDRHEVRLYGYSPGAELRLEPGFWRAPPDGAPTGR